MCFSSGAELAAGSTSRAAGGVRAQFSDPLNIALGRRSLEAFARFGERPGAEIDLHQVGYLFLLDREEDVAAFEERRAAERARRPIRLVPLDEAATSFPARGARRRARRDLLPARRPREPGGGSPGLRGWARRHGGTVVTGCALTGIELDGDIIAAWIRSSVRVATGTMVCAAGCGLRSSGAWSRRLPRAARPTRDRVHAAGPRASGPIIPLTVDFSTGFYFHREGPRLLFGMADREQQPGFDQPSDPAWLEHVDRRGRAAAPTSSRHGHGGGWKGYYEVTPDHNALIGVDSPRRFLYRRASRTTAPGKAPRSGEVVRDLVLERAVRGHAPSACQALRWDRGESRAKRDLSAARGAFMRTIVAVPTPSSSFQPGTRRRTSRRSSTSWRPGFRRRTSSSSTTAPPT